MPNSNWSEFYGVGGYSSDGFTYYDGTDPSYLLNAFIADQAVLSPSSGYLYDDVVNQRLQLAGGGGGVTYRGQTVHTIDDVVRVNQQTRRGASGSWETPPYNPLPDKEKWGFFGRRNPVTGRWELPLFSQKEMDRQNAGLSPSNSNASNVPTGLIVIVIAILLLGVAGYSILSPAVKAVV